MSAIDLLNDPVAKRSEVISLIDQMNISNRSHQNETTAILEAFCNKIDSGLAALETSNKNRDQAFELQRLINCQQTTFN